GRFRFGWCSVEPYPGRFPGVKSGPHPAFPQKENHSGHGETTIGKYSLHYRREHTPATHRTQAGFVRQCVVPEVVRYLINGAVLK
ncbi:hypothetical protein, partial [Allokutzneria sp. NRRL B-24872]|uniref:hypothetical protein n=1 Tax=Allokutzneria sp. NRRL B-24872 TaxID=1137961 RepID=UPI001AEFC2E5